MLYFSTLGRHWAKGLFVAVSTLALASDAGAQNFPTKALKIVVPNAAGGAADITARTVGQKLSEIWGQPVIIESKPGAAGSIGMEFAARQPADGYSLLVSHASVHIYATATRKTMPFDPVGDFTHMAMLVEAPMVILVRGQSPYQNFAQYLAAAKTKPVR